MTIKEVAFHGWRLARHGWVVVTEMHTVLWIFELLGIAVAPTALSWWMWVQGVPRSVVISIGMLVLGVLCFCILAGVGAAAVGAASQSKQSTKPLSATELEFKNGLRKLVLSQMDRLVEKYKVVVLGGAIKGPNTAFAEVSREWINTELGPHFDDLRNLVNTPCEEKIDLDRIQEAIVKFIRSYKNTRVIISQSISNNQDVVNLSDFARWKAADEQCLTALRDLKASPAATILKRAQDPWMASV